jgi:xanthine dehydrogenase YagS FAD-binding subunit
MQAFTINTPRDISAALAAGQKDGAKYIAGGTDLMQLAKEDVETPRQLVDLTGLLTRTITVNTGTERNGALRLGALATMSEVAANPDVRANWPAISEALLLSASPQIRNMGTMGGNLLQRTRCVYFRRVRLPRDPRRSPDARPGWRERVLHRHPPIRSARGADGDGRLGGVAEPEWRQAGGAAR